MARSWGCTPKEALDQPVVLVDQIDQMEAFARIYEKSKSNRKEMSADEWAFLEAMDRAVNNG